MLCHISSLYSVNYSFVFRHLRIMAPYKSPERLSILEKFVLFERSEFTNFSLRKLKQSEEERFNWDVFLLLFLHKQESRNTKNIPLFSVSPWRLRWLGRLDESRCVQKMSAIAVSSIISNGVDAVLATGQVQLISPTVRKRTSNYFADFIWQFRG